MAVALVELACDASARLGRVRVESVHIRIGPLAGVVEDALRFSFDLAAAGTAVEGAALRVEHAPLVAFCSGCHDERVIPSPQHLRCPACGASTPDVRKGRELELTAVEVSDVTDCPGSAEHPEEERSARG